MKIIVRTGDKFRGQEILLELDVNNNDTLPAAIDLELERWREWIQDVTKGDRLGGQVPPGMVR